MNNLQNKDTFTSLELAELINQFRREEGDRKELEHKDLLKIIRLEFEEEINEGKISPVEYADKKGEKRPMFILNLQQSRQVLVRESKFVRKAVIKYIDELENKLRGQFQVPTSFADALRLAAEQQERIEKLQLEHKENRPKVIFADAVASSQGCILVGDLAKIIKQNGVDIGQNRLFQWLRENGYLIQRKGNSFNMPTQKAMELDLFEIKETAITHADGHISINRTVKVTGKGQQYFINIFLNKEEAL